MKFCQPHWDALRAEIADRGLGQFVASGGHDAARRMKAELMEASAASNFEPLMGAHWAILKNLTASRGFAIMLIDGCPLCAANEQHLAECTDAECGQPAYYDKWLGRAADDQLQIARDMGLLA
ncbi:MAG TPA: hypothetical protein VIJ31_12065 [Acidothermaceae bacterium]